MQLEIAVEGEGLDGVELVQLPTGSDFRPLVGEMAKRCGFEESEALLFLEDGDDLIEISLVIDGPMTECVYHVHRALEIEVVVFYKEDKKSKKFRPSARVQRVLDWAVSDHGFGVDPAIAPEMELAIHGTTKELPKNAHIGRFVRHPHHKLELDLNRGVVPNGMPT